MAPDVALVPPGVVTVMFTAPMAPAGDTAVIWVADTTVNDAALVAPNLTALAFVKFVPVTVTLVPPVMTPVFGDTAVTVGAAT